MSIRYLLLIIILGLVFQSAIAQETQSNSQENRGYQDALVAFEAKEYTAAAYLFDTYLTKAQIPFKEAFYFKAVAELKSGNAQAVKEVESFMDTYPNNPLSGSGYFVLGNYYFDQRDFSKSLGYFSQVDALQLSVDETEEWKFKLGYTQLKTGDEGSAITGFEAATTYNEKYFDESSYYLGTIYFNNDDYNQALSALEPIDGKEGAFKDDVTIMIAGIYYHTSRYKQLYKYAEPQITKGVSDKNKQLNKLLGEAYFKEKQYAKSAEFLQRFLDLSGNRAEASTFFKLGFSYFQLNQNQKAVDNFKKAGLEKGALGQTSSFYLGQLYLREGNLNYAYSAFKTVAQAEGTEEMIEESAFTMGKVNFQREQYADAIEDFTSFLDRFANSRWKIEANELLAQSYLRTSNYDQAIAHLESIKNKSKPLRIAYQKVTFQKAQLLYNDSRFAQAAIYFDKAVTFPDDPQITAQSLYLKGESYSMLNEPGKASKAYRDCVNRRVQPWSGRANYGLGYLTYNQKDFDQAAVYFRNYVESVPASDPFYQDGMLRLADCYYVQKQYDRALQQYGKVIEPSMSSYVAYQQGLIYKLQGVNPRAETAFRLVAQDRASGYGDNALFQLAELQIEQTDFKAALSSLSLLLSDYPESNLFPFAKIQQALCYFNTGELEKSRDAYLLVLDNYLSHEVANEALLGLQEIAKKGLEIPGFENYMAAYEKAHPNDGSLEVVAFEAAKTSYYNQKYNEAIDKLNAFRSKYPESGFTQDAVYYMADAYYRSEQWQLAADTFDELIKMESMAYTGRSLDKRGKALIALGENTEAIKNYHLLLQRAMNQKESYLANEGLMTSFFNLNDTDSALYYSDAILKSEWKPANAEGDIWLLKARIYMAKENYASAMDELLQAANDSRNEKGAEAKYLISRIYYIQGKNKRSLEMLFELNRDYGSYPYWIGKSFLLIADNYLAMDELLQAKATVESIIANASIKEIQDEAQKRMELIQKKEETLLMKEADTLKPDSIK